MIKLPIPQIDQVITGIRKYARYSKGPISIVEHHELWIYEDQSICLGRVECGDTYYLYLMDLLSLKLLSTLQTSSAYVSSKLTRYDYKFTIRFIVFSDGSEVELVELSDGGMELVRNSCS